MYTRQKSAEEVQHDTCHVPESRSGVLWTLTLCKSSKTSAQEPAFHTVLGAQDFACPSSYGSGFCMAKEVLDQIICRCLPERDRYICVYTQAYRHMYVYIYIYLYIHIHVLVASFPRPYPSYAALGRSQLILFQILGSSRIWASRRRTRGALLIPSGSKYRSSTYLGAENMQTRAPLGPQVYK